jgi:hypothetical protein
MSSTETKRKDFESFQGRIKNLEPNPKAMRSVTATGFESPNPREFVESQANLYAFWVYVGR